MIYTVYHYEGPLHASDCFVGSNLGNAQNMCICMCFSRSRSDKRNVSIRVEPDTRLKRVSGTDKALLPSTSIIRVIRVNICARIE